MLVEKQVRIGTQLVGMLLSFCQTSFIRHIVLAEAIFLGGLDIIDIEVALFINGENIDLSSYLVSLIEDNNVIGNKPFTPAFNGLFDILQSRYQVIKCSLRNAFWLCYCSTGKESPYDSIHGRTCCTGILVFGCVPLESIRDNVAYPSVLLSVDDVKLLVRGFPLQQFLAIQDAFNGPLCLHPKLCIGSLHRSLGLYPLLLVCFGFHSSKPFRGNAVQDKGSCNS